MPKHCQRELLRHLLVIDGIDANNFGCTHVAQVGDSEQLSVQGFAELEIQIVHLETRITRQQVHLQTALEEFLEQVHVMDANQVRVHDVRDELEVLRVGLQVGILSAHQW